MALYKRQNIQKLIVDQSGSERLILNGPAKSDAEYAAAARLSSKSGDIGPAGDQRGGAARGPGSRGP